MKITRRNVLYTALFGASAVGLRSLATGLPASFLLDPEKALADTPAPTCGDASKAQFVILNTSASGDPMNANVPGMYEDKNIYHPLDPAMAPTNVTLGGKTYQAAAPWATLSADFDRTVFWHLMTDTPVHPKEPNVLSFNGAIQPADMFPSLLAKHLAPCLGTIQAQPITLGATSPSEGLSFEGAALPIIPPVALRATLTNPAGPLTNLQALRDQTLSQLNDLYRKTATTAQKKYIDSLVASQTQVRNISQNLLGALDSIKDNSPAAQLTAALALVQMKVTPVVAIHIPFGGDNHHDANLKAESDQTVAGVASIAQLLADLKSAGLEDSVSFISLNVFGRTLGPASFNGRQHNQNHQVSLTIGKPFRGGVVGGVGPVMMDYGALPIDSASGAGAASGDISAIDTLPSFGKTVMSALGVDDKSINYSINAGKVISAAIA